MISKGLGYLRKVFQLFFDFLNVKVLRKYPIVYFDDTENVGDLINPYLVKQLAHKSPHQVRSKLIRHAVCLGSMFHMANRNSVIWGTGVISDSSDFAKRTKCSSVYAVRGRLTKEILKKNGVPIDEDLVLGDPGLLMPLFYTPKINKSVKVGVIPHYVDKDFVNSIWDESFYIVDVSQSPEKFIDDISRCEFILSSSLHGLILSDSYGIPNKWVSFSEKITGGDFKFLDYYSTTSRPHEACLKIDGKNELIRQVSSIESVATVKEYTLEKRLLIDSFPKL